MTDGRRPVLSEHDCLFGPNDSTIRVHSEAWDEPREVCFEHAPWTDAFAGTEVSTDGE